jgi:K+-sensing histidine kinase KdpD
MALLRKLQRDPSNQLNAAADAGMASESGTDVSSKPRDLFRHLADLPTHGGVRSSDSPRTRVIRYAVAVVLTLVAWAISVALGSELGVPSHLPFVAAVAVATWYGGSAPGLVAAAISIMAIDLSFLPPIGSIELTHFEELVDSLVFLVVALTIGGTTTALRRARELAESRAAKLLDVTGALAEARSVDDVTAVVLDKGTVALEGRRAFLMLVDGDRVERLGAVGYADDMRQRTRLTSLNEDGPVSEAIKTRSPMWLRSVDEFRARYPKVYERVGAVSARQLHAIIPLLHGDDAVGALGISFADPSAVGVTDRALTLLLAQAAAAALQRARSFDVERDRRREAELTARGREQVLGIVAHDLRNPLHLMVATLELLEEPELAPERRRELLAIASRGVNHMRRLVGDLLDAVRIQAGHLSLDFEAVTLGAIVDQAKEMHRPLAAERGVSFETRVQDAGVVLRADRGRIQQVLGNLLGNAIKFTSKGGRVTLEARVEQGRAVFRVTDTGVGIPADRLPYIFERFWQGQSGDRNGVGLGLAITKAIVEAHRGSIEVESVPRKGSTFTFRIPGPATIRPEVETRRSEAASLV